MGSEAQTPLDAARSARRARLPIDRSARKGDRRRSRHHGASAPRHRGAKVARQRGMDVAAGRERLAGAPALLSALLFQSSLQILAADVGLRPLSPPLPPA